MDDEHIIGLSNEELRVTRRSLKGEAIRLEAKRPGNGSVSLREIEVLQLLAKLPRLPRKPRQSRKPVVLHHVPGGKPGRYIKK